eukprot:g1547.t1
MCHVAGHVYSDALKDAFHLEQHQIDTIPTFYFVGGSVSFFAGILNDRFGPSRVVAVGGSLTSFFVFAEWLIIKDKVPFIDVHRDNVVWLLSAANFGWALGNNMMTAPAFSTAIRNFPLNRGTVVGICKGGVGIIGGMLTQIWAGYMFVPDKQLRTVDYLLEVAAYVATVTIFSVPLIRVYDESDRSEATTDLHRRRIKYCYANLFLLCVIVGVAAATESSDGSSVRLAFAVCICTQVLAFFGVFLVQKRDTTTTKETPLLLNADSNEDDGNDVTKKTDSARGSDDDLRLIQVVKMRECWCLLLVAIALFGAGTMVTSNLAQMVTAHRMPTVVKSMGVSIFSFAQALSRMVAGVGADKLLHARVPNWYASRTFRLAEACVVMAVGQLALVVCGSVQVIFLVAVGLCGVGFGALHPLLVVCTSEIFGLRYHSQNYTFFDGMGSAISSVCLGQLLVQYVYERHTEGDATDCYGDDCFRLSHIAATGLCLVAATAAVYVTRIERTQALYRAARVERRDRLDAHTRKTTTALETEDDDTEEGTCAPSRFATGAPITTMRALFRIVAGVMILFQIGQIAVIFYLLSGSDSVINDDRRRPMMLFDNGGSVASSAEPPAGTKASDAFEMFRSLAGLRTKIEAILDAKGETDAHEVELLYPLRESIRSIRYMERSVHRAVRASFRGEDADAFDLSTTRRAALDIMSVASKSVESYRRRSSIRPENVQEFVTFVVSGRDSSRVLRSVARVRRMFGESPIVVGGGASPPFDSVKYVTYAEKTASLEDIIKSVRTPYAFVLHIAKEDDLVVLTGGSSALFRAVTELKRSEAGMLVPHFVRRRNGVARRRPASNVFWKTSFAFDALDDLSTVSDGDRYCYAVRRDASAVHVERHASTSTALRTAAQACDVSVGGALLLNMRRVRDAGGWRSRNAANSDHSVEVLDLAIRLKSNGIVATAAGSRDRASLSVLRSDALSLDQIFTFRESMNMIRGPSTHREIVARRNRTSVATRDDHDRVVVDQYMSMTQASSVRSVIGADGSTLNLGCTLDTPRCPFAAHAHDEDDHDEDVFGRSMLPSCCMRKLKETLQYVETLLTEAQIPHWIDYRTLIRSVVSSSSSSSSSSSDTSNAEKLTFLDMISDNRRENKKRGQCVPNADVASFTDADVGIMESDFSRLIGLMSACESDGYFMKRTGQFAARIFSSRHNGIHVVVRAYYLTESQPSLVDLSWTETASSTTDTRTPIIPLRFLKPIVLLSVPDAAGESFTVAAPNNAAELVALRFGDVRRRDWKTPALFVDLPFARDPSGFNEYDPTSAYSSVGA